jgi:hypothetical protein
VLRSPESHGFVRRLHRVEERLEGLAATLPAPGLTEPDPPTGERWEWGQVWAHLGEFVPYWLGQVDLILSRPAGQDPVPFGRVKSDPARVAAIEADRDRPQDELMQRLVGQLDELRGVLSSMGEAQWARLGLHSSLGEMSMPKIFDEFLIGHLEAHADQLDGLVSAGGGT